MIDTMIIRQNTNWINVPYKYEAIVLDEEIKKIVQRKRLEDWQRNRRNYIQKIKKDKKIKLRIYR